MAGFGGGDNKRRSGNKKKKSKSKRADNNDNNRDAPVTIVDPSSSSVRERLAPDALALLEEARGDVALARANYLGYSLAFLEQEMPELYDGIKRGSAATDPTVRKALVELTWDAVAAYVPVMNDSGGRPEGTEIRRRLRDVASAVTGAGGRRGDVLDVGCGNGLLLPFLLECSDQNNKNNDASFYRGVDLSPRMVELARADHPDSGAVFDEADFDDRDDRRYGAIVFNGSLQFFANAEDTLRSAAGSCDRVVLSHVNGAAFVRRERQESPATVLVDMPGVAELRQIADALGAELTLPGCDVHGDDNTVDTALDEFYLAVLSTRS